MCTLRSGLRACSVNSEGQVLIASKIRLRSKRTRSEPALTSAPAFLRMARAPSCMKSMPISSRICSEVLWIASSSSSDTMGVGGMRCFKWRYLAVDGAVRTVPLPRPARRRAGAAVVSSVMGAVSKAARILCSSPRKRPFQPPLSPFDRLFWQFFKLDADNPPPGHKKSRKTKMSCGLFWCPRPESNRHALRRRILSPLRLPIPPPGLNYAWRKLWHRGRAWGGPLFGLARPCKIQPALCLEE